MVASTGTPSSRTTSSPSSHPAPRAGPAVLSAAPASAQDHRKAPTSRHQDVAAPEPSRRTRQTQKSPASGGTGYGGFIKRQAVRCRILIHPEFFRPEGCARVAGEEHETVGTRTAAVGVVAVTTQKTVGASAAAQFVGAAQAAQHVVALLADEQVIAADQRGGQKYQGQAAGPGTRVRPAGGARQPCRNWQARCWVASSCVASRSPPPGFRPAHAAIGLRVVFRGLPGQLVEQRWSGNRAKHRAHADCVISPTWGKDGSWRGDRGE